MDWYDHYGIKGKTFEQIGEMGEMGINWVDINSFSESDSTVCQRGVWERGVVEVV